MILSVVFMATGVGLCNSSGDLFYSEFNLAIGVHAIPQNFIPTAVRLAKMNQAAILAIWTCIFGVKFSFILFFWPLVRNVHDMRKLWWAVLAVLVCCAPPCMFLGFYVCHDLTAATISEFLYATK